MVGSGLDDPDQNFYENYICDSNRNYTHACDRDLDKMIDQQSMEPDQQKRKDVEEPAELAPVGRIGVCIGRHVGSGPKY